jgi:hypothetical protein
LRATRRCSVSFTSKRTVPRCPGETSGGRGARSRPRATLRFSWPAGRVFEVSRSEPCRTFVV